MNVWTLYFAHSMSSDENPPRFEKLKYEPNTEPEHEKVKGTTEEMEVTDVVASGKVV